MMTVMYNQKKAFLTFWFYPIFKNKKQKTNKNKKSKLKCKGFYNTMFMSVPSVYFYNTMFMSVPSVYFYNTMFMSVPSVYFLLSTQDNSNKIRIQSFH